MTDLLETIREGADTLVAFTEVDTDGFETFIFVDVGFVLEAIKLEFIELGVGILVVAAAGFANGPLTVEDIGWGVVAEGFVNGHLTAEDIGWGVDTFTAVDADCVIGTFAKTDWEFETFTDDIAGFVIESKSTEVTEADFSSKLDEIWLFVDLAQLVPTSSMFWIELFCTISRAFPEIYKIIIKGDWYERIMTLFA